MRKLTKKDVMPFGIHQGKKMKNVSPQYLINLLKSPKGVPRNVLSYVMTHLNELKQGLEVSPELLIDKSGQFISV